MNKYNKRILMSVGLAILIVFSVITTAAVGIAEEDEEYTLTVNIEGEGTVTDHDGFEFVDGETKDYPETTGVNLTADPDEHWYFVNWTGDYESEEEEITVDMDDDKEITALFEEHEYKLTVNVEGNGSVDVEPEEDTYEPGTEVNLTADPDEHWYFVNWTGDYESEEEEITVNMDDDKEITAEFGEVDRVEIEPSEDFNLTAGDTTNFSAIAYDGQDEPITEDDTEFEWNNTDEYGLFNETKAGDYEVYATYRNVSSDKVTVTVKPTDVEYVEIDPKEDQLIEVGDEVVFSAEAYDEYRNLVTDDLREFEWENASRGVFYYETLGEYNVTATFEGEENVTSEPTKVRVVEELYDLTINVDGEGKVEVDPDQQGYEEDTDVNLTAVPEDGWYFVEWTGDYEGVETEIMITMDEDKEITAVFEEEEVPVEEYDLIINVEGEGTTDPSEGTHTYVEEKVVTVEATPAEGWKFIGWTGDVTGTEATIEITMDDDKEIWAIFEEEDEPLEPYFEVEITAPGDGTEYYEGDTVTVEFTVTNTGDIVGTQDIVFSVDGDEVDRMENVDVVSGGTISGEFEWEADDEGDYRLEVASEDEEDSVEVSVQEEDDELLEELLEIPGFTTILLILGAVIAVSIYYKKEQ